MFEFLKNKKENIDIANTPFDGGSLGELGVGNNDNGVIVNVVSRKKINKNYVVGGVLDQETKNNWKAWFYLAPVLILMAIFLIYPLINTIFISFTENYKYATGTFDGLTLDNFAIILGLKPISGTGETAIYETNLVTYAIPNTFIIVFLTVPVSICIALIISVLLNNLKWFQKVYQTVFFLPYVTNSIAVGMVFSVLFDKFGLVNYIFHSDITWIYGADRWVAMVPLCLYIVWSSLPFKILILLSGLQNVDKQYYDAAKIDGAPKWKVLLKITVPALRPQILYLMVTSFIGAFKEYTSVVGLFNGPGTSGKGSYEMYTMVFYIYENLQQYTSYAAAAAVLLFLIILVFTFLQLYINKKKSS